jgi:predicted transcriptional regulator
LIEDGKIDKKDRVVSLITSSGLKTNDILQSINRRRKSPGIGAKLVTKERILKNISKKSTYGYAIWKNFGREMTLGAVYQHLSDLEKKGLITSQIDGKRRYFEITEKGNRVLSVLDELRILL